jgi:peptide/nickel transport system substrate-binding protein
VARRLLGVFLLAALFVAGCGDDDGDEGSASSTTAGVEDGATDEPATGGEVTALIFNEIAGVDPVSSTGAAGADGQRMFALYGALLAYDAESNEVVPVLAESFEPDAAFTTWTLTLKPDLTFSDGTPFDAQAVLTNWNRAKDPANRSQAIGVANTIANATVVDAVTLELSLAAPNAHFGNGIARNALNYIASPAAIPGGQLANTPVGAGPFLLESWVRDDRMVLVPNPDWKGSDGPYLDRLTFRIVGDEGQRVDTFVTGGAELFYTPAPASVEAASEGRDGEYARVAVSGGGTIIFNTANAPFDDARIRRAVAMGVDAAAMTEAVRPGAIVATNPMLEDTRWYTPDADYPGYDREEAQRLFDEYRDETGEDITFTLGSFQQSENVATAQFVQASLNQFDGVDVTVDVADAPTATQRVLQRNYQAHLWGFPVLDPDPGLYNALRSGLPTNVTGYANSEVDALLDEARVTADNDARAELYHQALALYVEDMPFWHTLHPNFGYFHSDDVTGVELYEDGNLRSDLLRLAG